MVNRLDRKQAVERIKKLLEKSYPSAERGEADYAKWALAFPAGFIPEQSDTGEIINASVVPNIEDQSHINQLLERAVSGDTLAFDAVMVWAGWHLAGYRDIPHEQVKTLAARYLSGFTPRPKGKGGRKTKYHGHQLQYSNLRYAVWLVKSWGFIVERKNTTDHRDTACDIVAEAMNSLKKSPSSYDHIRRIWHSGPRLG